MSEYVKREGAADWRIALECRLKIRAIDPANECWTVAYIIIIHPFISIEYE